MVLASVKIEDKLERARFFQKTFLLVDISVKMVLRLPFLTFSNANIQFIKKELIWRSYTIVEALPTTKQIKLIDKKEFAKTALDENTKAFVVHVTSLSLSKLTMSIHLVKEA